MIPVLRVITDDRGDEEITRAAERICRRGNDAVCIHLRDKRRSAAELKPLALRLREITRTHGSQLVLGDAYELADLVEFDGLHGWSAPNPFSVPAHDDRDIERALAVGAKCALVSPIFESPQKGTPRGLGALTSARKIAPALFLYALGGVNASNARSCIAAGANGIAAIRAFETSVSALLDAVRSVP